MKTIEEIRSDIFQQIDDLKLESGINNKLKIDLDGKLAIITGQFHDQEQKRRILEIITAYPQMKVLCDAGVEMDMSESEADRCLKEQIMKTLGEGLRYYQNVRVLVSAGRVFLDGKVSQEKDRQIIFALIDQLSGVKSIINNLTYSRNFSRMSHS
ncbi:BON domain-containing protein [Dyadobacter tibetensis]|uniref:BON domain-containing protein n=1 Tax=Dyadobacter tibetensis TaxID=1211851 RepID=UPI000470A2DB|nr:BON domain-containing protein [Dyadobacter tibetensis]